MKIPINPGVPGSSFHYDPEVSGSSLCSDIQWGLCISGRKTLRNLREIIEGAQWDMRISRGIIEEIQAASKNGLF